ncbi:MAG TPA: aminotransferase class III-fold pyridoxal phosphate-dependent enzyme [Vicinamibacterales bacterium]|nr:aminotransferase class III-fold pyridoxal phosphate-dependent enzyme [Vicinamibacterales bacterium]
MPASSTSAPSLDVVAAAIKQAFNLSGTLTRLPGQHLNYRLDLGSGRQFVVKVAEDYNEPAVDLQFRLVELAHAAELGIALPRVYTTTTGHATSATTFGSSGLRVRLLDFVPGTTWAETPVRPAGLFGDLGRVLAALNRALTTLGPPDRPRTHAWDLAAALQHRGKIALVTDRHRRQLLEWTFLQYAGAVPELARLPHALIHGDANDENVLVAGDRVSGLIDFGDALWNPSVCELAIALAYAMLDEDDPLTAGARVVAGYDAERSLSLDELRVLLPLVLGRLSVTVAMAAHHWTIDPDHPTWFVTEARAWALLERLTAIDPADAGTRLAAGTGRDPHADRGAPAADLLARRRRVVGSALSVAYRAPLKIVRGRGPFLIDDRGRTFLDLVNNVCHVGHCHRRVVEAAARQMARLNTNTRYLHDYLIAYAERLTATLPAGLDVCLFVTSGSEANELALRLAMTQTGRRDLLVVDGAYHGHTSRLIAASPYKFMGPGGSGVAEPWVHVVPMPDGYRGVHRGATRATGVAYGDEVGRVLAAAPAPVAAFLTESLMSCGGQIVPPPGYLETAFAHVRRAGGLCIVDEVQTGFGRVGSHFWGFELQNVVPDIVVLGKPMGNGHPIGAVVTTRAIADAFANGMEFFSTFGGNPVSCAVGLAVLDVIADEGLQAHALDVGTRLRQGLSGLSARHPLLGDVRGAGLFVGVDLVRDRATREPAAREADDLVNRLASRGILASTDGPHHNVIKIKPPMVVTADDVDMVVRVLDDELGRAGDAGLS